MPTDVLTAKATKLSYKSTRNLSYILGLLNEAFEQDVRGCALVSANRITCTAM